VQSKMSSMLESARELVVSGIGTVKSSITGEGVPSKEELPNIGWLFEEPNRDLSRIVFLLVELSLPRNRFLHSNTFQIKESERPFTTLPPRSRTRLEKSPTLPVRLWRARPRKRLLRRRARRLKQRRPLLRWRARLRRRQRTARLRPSPMRPRPRPPVEPFPARRRASSFLRPWRRCLEASRR